MVDNAFLWVGFTDTDSFEDLRFVRDLIAQTDSVVCEYIQHDPDATLDPVSSTLVHPDGRVARWPSKSPTLSSHPLGVSIGPGITLTPGQG